MNDRWRTWRRVTPGRIFTLLITTGFAWSLMATVAAAGPAPCGSSDDGDEKSKTEATEKQDDDGGCGKSTGDLNQLTAQDLKRIAEAKDSPGGKPQWFCETPLVSVEPLWVGKSIDATWTIQNKGDADLVINLKGG